MFTRSVLTVGVAAFCASATAATVTLDLNGFPNRTGGQVTGPGLDTPIPIPAGEQKVVLSNLQSGATYQVDFFHNSLDSEHPAYGSSDCNFVVANDGKGIESVGLGGGVHSMVDGFQRGDTTLKLKTFPILYNANSAQTGSYYIHGLMDAHTLPANSGPQKLVAIPGTYRVDNLYNSNGGREDFTFVVTAEGKVGPVEMSVPADVPPTAVIFRASDEYAEFSGAEVRPRATIVHIKIEASAPVQFNPTHTVTNVAVEGGTVDLDMPMLIGGGGLNLWNFGTNIVTGGNLITPDGAPEKGMKRDNDYYFYPLLRFDPSKKEFYFLTTEGASQTATGEAEGVADDGSPLKAKVTATIRSQAKQP